MRIRLKCQIIGAVPSEHRLDRFGWPGEQASAGGDQQLGRCIFSSFSAGRGFVALAHWRGTILFASTHMPSAIDRFRPRPSQNVRSPPPVVGEQPERWESGASLPSSSRERKSPGHQGVADLEGVVDAAPIEVNRFCR